METAVATKQERQNKALENATAIKEFFIASGFSVREAVYALPQSERSCWDATKNRWKNTRRGKDDCRFILEVREGSALYQFLVRIMDADYEECVVCLWTLCNTNTSDGTMRILHEPGKPLGMYHVSPEPTTGHPGPYYIPWFSGLRQWFEHILDHIRLGYKKCDMCGGWSKPEPGTVEGLHTYVCLKCAPKYKW